MSKNKKRLKRIESLLSELVQAANKNSLANKDFSRRLEQIERSLNRFENANAKVPASDVDPLENEKPPVSSHLIAHRY